MSAAVLRKLARLSRTEWIELFQAQAALLWAQVLVWTRPTGQLIDRSVAADSAPAAESPAALDPRAYRLALAVGRAAEHGVFRPLCLVRAVALNRMLEARHIHGSRIRIGVKRTEGHFIAHAWVEWGNIVLGDMDSHVNRFTQLADVHLIDPR